MVASCLQKKELWYPSFGFQAIDCNHATAASQWRIVENQLLDAFSLRGLEAGLPAFQLPMVGKCDVLPKGDLFDLLVSGIYSRHSFWDFQAPEAGSWQRQYAPPVLHDGCIMPIPSLQLQKKAPVSCREAKRLVTQLWSPRFVAIQWLCSQLCYETAAN